MESVIFLLLLAISGGHPQQLDFLKLPPSLQLNTAHHKLATNEIEALITNILGIPSDMHWQGLRRQPAFEYPKANLLFVVEGFDSPSESHDQADAEWIVIRTQVRGHNGTPPLGPPAARGLAALRAYFVCFSYY
jgi:hypothetical protein